MEQDHFKYLPDEVIFEIALGLEPKSLVRFCFTSKRFSTVCQDEYFWRRKFIKDFPEVKKYKETYKKSYIEMVKETKLTKLLKFIPEDEIDWEVLSSNPCLTQKFIEKFIELNLDKKWYWRNLIRLNPAITPEFIERHPDRDWDWRSLSSNPAITPEFVEKHINKDWNWGGDGLSRNPSITPEFIERHINENWDWGEYGLSRNPSITPEFIERHINEDWEWEWGLSRNPAITPEFIERHINEDWEWGAGEHSLSSNPAITFNFIKNNLDKPWNWGHFGFSSNNFSPDKDHLEPKDVLSRIKGVPENLIKEQIEEKAKEEGISKEKALVKDLTSEFDKFPDELIWMVMLKMNFKSLSLFCSVSRRIKNICDDERFWREKIKVDYGTIKKGKNMTYKQLYKQLSTENTLIRLIKTYPEKGWDFYALSENTGITQKFIEYAMSPEFQRKYGAEVKWDFELLSANPVVTPDFIRKHPNWDWDWINLSRNPSMTMEFIYETSNKPWDWDYVLEYNPNLTEEFIKANDHLDLSRLMYNHNLC